MVVALCLGAGNSFDLVTSFARYFPISVLQLTGCAALRCHTSNGHSRGVNDNGGSYECAPVHGATTRHCVKFETGEHES